MFIDLFPFHGCMFIYEILYSDLFNHGYWWTFGYFQFFNIWNSARHIGHFCQSYPADQAGCVRGTEKIGGLGEVHVLQRMKNKPYKDSGTFCSGRCSGVQWTGVCWYIPSEAKTACCILHPLTQRREHSARWASMSFRGNISYTWEYGYNSPPRGLTDCQFWVGHGAGKGSTGSCN